MGGFLVTLNIFRNFSNASIVEFEEVNFSWEDLSHYSFLKYIHIGKNSVLLWLNNSQQKTTEKCLSADQTWRSGIFFRNSDQMLQILLVT